MDTKCKHENFSANVSIGRLSTVNNGPITGYTADINIKCAECGLPFRFIGLECGASPHAPKVNADATELRAPLEPAYATEVLGISVLKEGHA